MYKEFFNLKENPFNVTADPDFFFSSSRHTEALSHLTYGIKQRKGILVVTGEVGTGKTTLCRTLLSKLDDTIKTALILNPSFSDVQLLKLILKDLGIEKKCRNKYEHIDALNEFLIKETNRGNNVVLIIDEAQNIGTRQLEQIRLLSNLETEKDKLLQIILVGQPELAEKLELKALRQLNQRVTVRYHMKPLNQDELTNYIHHRLQVATQGELKVSFSDEAIEKIFEVSKGTPRMVNIFCDRALLAGFVKEVYTLDKHIVEQSVQEVMADEYY